MLHPIYHTARRRTKELMGILCIISLLVGGIAPQWLNAAINNVLMTVPVSAWTLTITSPSSFTFSPIPAAFITGIATQDFTGSTNYFIVTDLKGLDSGYSTTLQMASDLVTGGNRISSGNVAFKADLPAATLLSGSTNALVITDSSATGWFQALNVSRTFIYRGTWPNTWLLSQYAQNISMQITVPAGQPAGAYSGWLVYTLIEN